MPQAPEAQWPMETGEPPGFIYEVSASFQPEPEVVSEPAPTLEPAPDFYFGHDGVKEVVLEPDFIYGTRTELQTPDTSEILKTPDPNEENLDVDVSLDIDDSDLLEEDDAVTSDRSVSGIRFILIVFFILVVQVFLLMLLVNIGIIDMESVGGCFNTIF
jgi:hypothetical protein